MAVFFVDWELWQEMTFVLGCCIVLVFVIGLVKLWWTNRTIRRLEIIDEEKRSRLSHISHCGIENMRPPEIPFGIRALQSGVEVEGIWISRPNSPGPCQLTPVATQVGRRMRISRGKGRMINISSSECLPATLDSGGTPTDLALSQTSQQDDIISMEDAPTQQEYVDPGHPTTQAQVDLIYHQSSQENREHSGSWSSSSRNDTFITPKQTPQASISSHTEAPDKDKGHSESDAILNAEQTSATPHGRRTEQGRVAISSGPPRALRSENRQLISDSSSS
ncbi:hypothetical protein F53441_11164 [Fusarium austroafricanum]|uniref:Uncharacterized protein n=1 Tax=Fusarium austroafricanum TaxID=2364996 RepID=A0A8H4K437_9HYPO|nr:hypothetical protein F53441_11164 [Fusarium austroafricanum]